MYLERIESRDLDGILSDQSNQFFLGTVVSQRVPEDHGTFMDRQSLPLCFSEWPLPGK